MRFGVFGRHAQIKNMRIQHKTLVRNFECLYLVVFFSVQNMLPVGGECFPQMHIVAVAPKAITTVGLYFYGALLDFFKDAFVGKNHINSRFRIFDFDSSKVIWKIFKMPLFFQQAIDESTRLGVWRITEDESFFAGILLQRSITHPHKRLQHLAGRHLLRFLFPNFPLALVQITDTNKPYLNDDMYHFSISHGGDLAAAIVSTDKRVGVDIEKVRDKINRFQHKFVSASEQAILANTTLTPQQQSGAFEFSTQALTLLWCCKEAVFKWYGKGGVDFKEHISVSKIETKRENEFLVHAVLLKDEPGTLQLNVRFFDDWVLSYVVT